MDSARHTDERLRSALNGNQPSRERMCIAVLSLNRNYAEVKPRRPEGGPDGGRDIECLRGFDTCFGAVGFVNNASDTTREKREISRKFKSDLDAALARSPDLKAFVFFTNVDLTPGEIEDLETVAEGKGVSFVDIYWRERIRIALDSPEGLALRYQYLNLPLSDAEQASFFSRFGKDLEDLVVGRLDRIERKLDELEFARWQSGRISKLELEVKLKATEEFPRRKRDHFRIALELQGVTHENRSIIIGGRDDYWAAGRNGWHFGTKTFFHRQRVGKIENSWIPQGVRASNKHITKLIFGVQWRPTSNILAAEFDGLAFNFHFTENLIDRIARVKFTIDDYEFLDTTLRFGSVDYVRPSLGWPDILTEDELAIPWRYCDLGYLTLASLPKRTG